MSLNSNSPGSSQEHYKYFISNIDKEYTREHLNRTLIVPLYKPYIQGKRVLELGGGPGYFGRYIQNNCSLINTDISFSFLKEAEDKYTIKGVQADIIHLPFTPNAFDVIVATGVFVYFSPDTFPMLLKECRRVLRPGGYLLFHEPFPYVRWYKTLLRLLFLDFLEPTVNKVYSRFAQIRGYTLQQDQEALVERPSLFLRSEKEYISLLQKEHFSPVHLRLTFVNFIPPRIGKYFLSLGISLCPLLTKIRRDIANGIVGIVKLEQH